MTTATLFNYSYGPGTRRDTARAARHAAGRHRGRRHGRLDDGADPGTLAARRGVRDHAARVPGGRHHRRRGGLDALAARLLRQPRHRGGRVDARLPCHLQVRHHLRGLVDQAGLREATSTRSPRCSTTSRCASSCTTSRRASTAPTCTRTRTASSSPRASPPSAVRRSRRENFPFDIWHGYHFDAVLLGPVPAAQGARARRALPELPRHARHARPPTAPSHRSARRRARRSPRTCSSTARGFAGLLDRQGAAHARSSASPTTSSTTRRSRCRRPSMRPIPSETVSTALKHGWAWKIPLTSRYGNGYVYSTQFCSPDEAETRAARSTWAARCADVPARHLKMKIGRVTQHWNKNCLAVGLSQGFIEPLEATALLFIQQTATTFVDFLERGDLRRGRPRALQPAGQRALRGHPRLHRHALQDQHAHRHRVLARQRREPQPLGRPEEAVLRCGWAARASPPASGSR